MSIEKFDPNSLMPQKKASLLDRARALLVKRKDAPVSREFYSKDGRSRFEFYEWRDGDLSRQLNIALQYKIGPLSWGGIMKAMTRWEGKNEQAFAVEVEVLTDNAEMCELATYLYERSTGGKKMFMGEWGRPMEVTTEGGKSEVRQLGFLDEKTLPEYIDFEGTIQHFLLQARRLDFSTPVLIEKPLMK